MSSNGYKELTAWKDRHTTGKSIGHLRAVPPYLMSSQTSALSVVVKLNGELGNSFAVNILDN